MPAFVIWGAAVTEKKTRKEIADGLKAAACSYLLRKGFSCHLEIGVARWGTYRADVLAVTLKGTVCICEVKSCVQDFMVDHRADKWKNYLPTCNQFYFVMLPNVWEKLKHLRKELRDLGAGVLILDQYGFLKVAVPSKYRPMKGADKKEIVIRMAWRNGDVSKRTHRRKRVFLGQEGEGGKDAVMQKVANRKAKKVRRKRRTRKKRESKAA